MTTAIARKPAKRTKFNLKSPYDMKCVTEWPETMDILSGENFCLGSLKDNGHGCLLGHAACHFIPEMWPFQLRGAPLPEALTFEDVRHGLVGESDIERIMATNKIGRAFLKALTKAGVELTGEEYTSAQDLNDTQPEQTEGHYRTEEDIQRHLNNVARIWNRALDIVGYEAGEPSPLKRDPAY